MKLTSIRSWILPLLAAIVSVVVIGSSLLLRFLDLDIYKAEIAAQVRSALKRDLKYETGDFSLRFGPSFTFVGVTVKEKDGVRDFIKADRLTIRIALIPLFRRELVLSRMRLEHPELLLSRDRDGVFNVSDLFTQTPGGEAPGIRGVELKNARVRFTDQALPGPALVTELSEIDLYLSRLVAGKDCDFKLSGFLGYGTGKVPIFLAGVARLPKTGAPFTTCEINGRVRTGALDAGHFWPYYQRFVPFRSLAGELAVEGSFKGRPNAFKSKGDLKVTRLNLDYPQVFHARLTPKSLKASYELELTNRDLNISAVKLNLDGLSVQGNCRLSNIHSGDLRITAKGVSNRFNLHDFRAYIPYGIIVKGTADFIEQKITGGLYRLDQGTLDGRVSQILHMERDENYKILDIRAHVEEGVVNYGSGIPLFSGIKGELDLAGKDFILKGMTGSFGGSPLTLDGRIADFPLEVPTRYLFTAAMHPRQQEAAWLMGHGRGEKLTLADGSSLKLKGEGTSALYNLSGDWDLTAPGYSYPDLIAKPPGRPNTIAFKIGFAPEQFRITGLSYQLGSLAVSATALSGYWGPLSLDVKTNQFSAAEIAPLLPAARKYQPAGKVHAQLHGEGEALDQLTWTGNVALAGVSFRPGEKIKPVSGVNGTLRVGADSLESSQLAVRLGNSAISGHGTLNGFKSPAVTLVFSSPLLDLADLGFPQGRQPVRAEKVQGSLTYRKDSLQISALSATIGKSVLQVKGSVLDLQRPQAELSIQSPHLELEDLFALFASPSGSGTTTHFTLKANLAAAEGRAHDLPFQHLKTVIMLEDKILYLQPFDFSSLEGDVSGKMRVDFGSGPPRYQVNCSLQRVSAEKLLHAIGVQKQEVTGTLSLQGELTAKGEGAADLKKSALGAVKLKVEHGTIRKFATLSKVFSILNVSQLFRLHLPDMVAGGMPYNKLTGDFAIRDGFASTQNLYLDSNAISVSAVGKLDLLRNQLDLNLGVRPLQTVDKVVSRIPIVGWILTGKDHSLVTTYFEAKGPIEDPQVTAVPVKSLAKGVMNIFKRVFELPGRLITDTGEVIIGN